MKDEPTWCAAVDRYLSSRDVSDNYVRDVRTMCRRFGAFAGNPAITDLTDTAVNEWLESLKSEGYSKKRIWHHRMAVLAVWRQEVERGNIEHGPRFVRRIKVPRNPVTAWTQDELRAFVAACKIVPGTMRDQSVSRSFWWATWANVAYDTALRRADSLTIPWAWYDAATGSIQRPQSKTGNVVALWMNPVTVAMLNHLDSTTEYVLTWPYHSTKFDYWLRKIVAAAGIRKGTSRWIRRSAASYTERDNPGQASRLLGHKTPGMVAYYLDPAIVNVRPVRPPEL